MACNIYSAHLFASDLLSNNNPGRYSNSQCACRHVIDNNSIGTNLCIVPNTKPPKDLGAGADIDAVAQNGRTQRVIQSTVPYRHTLANNAVVAHLGVAVNDNSS